MESSRFGDEIDLHTVAFEGHAVVYDGENGGIVPLLPSSMINVDTVMKAGHWSLFDATSDHYRYGSRVQFKVSGDKEIAPDVTEDKIARYFVAADEVEWNYAPEGQNMCSNSNLLRRKMCGWPTATTALDPSTSKLRIESIKTQSSIRLDLVQNLDLIQPLGTWELGPVIKASVGENIEIFFRNNLGEPTSLVPIAGALVPSKVEAVNEIQKARQTSDKLLVVPGGEIKMTIHVGKDAGPSGRKNTVSYIYASNANLIRDINTGLMGLIIIHGEKGRHAKRCAFGDSFESS